MTTDSEYRELDARVRATPGFKVQHSIDYVAESHKVLDGNTRELEEELAGFRGALSEFDWSQDPGGRAHISELNRRMHNYVTARMTLRDHTIKALEDIDLWEGSDWYRDVYQPKVKAIMVNDSFAFLQDLRNYATHRRPLPISAGISGSAAGVEQHISLDVERLEQSDKWSAGAKRFLEAQGKKVDISQLVIDYKAAAGEFYSWLPGAIMEAKHDEIMATQVLWEERQRMHRDLVNETGS